jgi:plastocyanin
MVGAGFAVLGLVATGRGVPAATAQTAAVTIVDFAFQPATLTVPVGTTVTWTNTGNAPHTTTSTTGLWDSGTLNTGGSFSRQFNQVGTFAYHCTIHPNMTATIMVQAATITPTQTATATPAMTATAPAGMAQWLDRPPVSSDARPSCPAAQQWLLLYWSGGDGIAIATAAAACASADIYWVNREGRWLGFAKAAAAASDSWNVLRGEAHFVHGAS